VPAIFKLTAEQLADFDAAVNKLIDVITGQLRVGIAAALNGAASRWQSTGSTNCGSASTQTKRLTARI
jgi:hypothetical protein